MPRPIRVRLGDEEPGEWEQIKEAPLRRRTEWFFCNRHKEFSYFFEVGPKCDYCGHSCSIYFPSS